MNLDKPTLIFSSPRCGSSLVGEVCANYRYEITGESYHLSEFFGDDIHRFEHPLYVGGWVNVNIVPIKEEFVLSCKKEIRLTDFYSEIQDMFIFLENHNCDFNTVIDIIGSLPHIEKFYKNFGLNYTILRFGSLYGSRSGNSNGIKSLINNAVNNKKIVYEGSKRAERMYVHVEDVANVCVKIIQEKYKNKYLTITGKRIVKVRNLIKMIAKHLKISKSKIKYLNRKNHGHYDKKPTLFSPRIGNKLTIKEQKDFKKRIINLIH